jgi:hypothetical protein
MTCPEITYKDFPRRKRGEPMSNELGVSPNGHSVTYPQCGYVGCLDLRVWAKANRYRYRLEESYKVEDSEHVRGDGRWFVEVLCQNGLLYPFGGTTLLAYAKGGVANRVAELGPDVQPYQTDGKNPVFKFPIERLDEVAAILRPRKRRTLDPDRARAISRVIKPHAQGGQIEQATHALHEIDQTLILPLTGRFKPGQTRLK